MVTIKNPEDPRVQALFLKAHLKLMALGMKNSRLSKQEMLNKAGSLTGKKYKGKDISLAIDDLDALIKSPSDGVP